MKSLFQSIFSIVLILTFFEIPSFAYTDVNNTHSNFEAITHLQEKNIIKGYADGSFRPNSTIKRDEF